MKTKYFGILLFWLFYQTPIKGLSQTENEVLFNDKGSVQKISNGGSGYYALNPTYDEIEGSPYLFNWAIGKVIIKDEAVANEYEICYDANKDIFLMRYKDFIWEIDQQKVDTLIVENKKFISIEGGYYQMLGGNKVLLLKQYKAEILAPTYIPALDTGSKNSVWQMSSNYFLVKNSTLTRVKLTKKSLQKSLNLSKEFLKQLDKNSLKFNDENDVIKIIGYLD